MQRQHSVGRALHTERPCRIRQWCAWRRKGWGVSFSNFCSTASTVLPDARPVRLPTRKMCVSTAKVSAPKAQFMTTRSEEHTSELQSLMRISYAVFCLKKKNSNDNDPANPYQLRHV